MHEVAELAVPYAMLLCHDDKVEINEENITKLLGAAGITVEPIWIKVFVQAFAGQDIGKFLTNISAGVGSGAAAGSVAAPAASGSVAAPAGGKKEEKKKEESEEEEEMGFGLFD